MGTSLRIVTLVGGLTALCLEPGGEIASVVAQSAADVQANIAYCTQRARGAEESIATRDAPRLAKAIEEYCTTRGYLEKAGADLGPLAASDGQIGNGLDVYLGLLLTEVEKQRKLVISRSNESQQGSEMDRILRAPGGASQPRPERGMFDPVAHQKAKNTAALERDVEAKLACYRRVAPSSPQLQAHAAKLESLRTTLKNPQQSQREQRAALWEQWFAKAREKFDELWAITEKAEGEARPLVEQGLDALNQKSYADAQQKLLEARTRLYRAYLPTPDALTKAETIGWLRNGLSYEIAEGLARIAQAQKNDGLLWAQSQVLRYGRPWGPKEAEFLLAAQEASGMIATVQGRDWSTALVPPPGAEVVSACPYDTKDKMIQLGFSATRTQGKACERLGIQCMSGARLLESAPGILNADQYVLLEEPVSKIVGNTIEIDLRYKRNTAYDCKETDRVDRINPFTGVVTYREDCKYKEMTTGHLLQLDRPAELKEIKKGDVVTLYGLVKKGAGRNIKIQNPTYLMATRDKQILWYQGVAF